MPVIDGQVRRSRFTSLKLRELSSVDNPAQIGARMAIMKRHDVGKEYDPNEARDDHGRWSADGSGVTGTPHKLGGVTEMGFAPTLRINEAGDKGPNWGSAEEAVRPNQMYDAAHAQLKESLNIDDLGAHAVLTSSAGRHLADQVNPGDGPIQLKSRIKTLIASDSRGGGWSKTFLRPAEAFHNGEGTWPSGMERLARTRKAAEIAKYIGDGDEGAQSFQDVLAENKFSQNVWPCVDALSQSIRSIVGDSSLTGGDRDAAISNSVDQFLQSVRDIAPEVSKQLEPLLVRKKEGLMPKTVDQLQTEVDSLTSKLAIATADVATAKAAQTAAEEAKAKAEGDCATAKTALDAVKAEGGELATVKAELATTKAALTKATDETIKYGGEEIKKSEVGDGPFKIAKGATIEAQNQRLEKRAGEEFSHVVGTTAEKALVLKTVDALAEEDPTRKALETILKAAEKMTAAGFGRIGAQGGVEPTLKAAQGTFDGKVNEVMARDKCTKSQAMSKARGEFPTEYAAAYPDSSPAATNAN